jgi:hypothetical protein
VGAGDHVGGGVLAAIVIDQGASRRDREERQAIANSGREARVGLLRRIKTQLDACAKAIEQREPTPGLVLEGLGVESLRVFKSVVDHYIARGSDDDPGLVWVLCRAGNIVEAAVDDLYRRPIETTEQRATLAERARSHAQSLYELTDEYQAGLFNTAV